MISQRPARDDDRLTPPIRPMAKGIGFMVAGFLANAGVFALDGALGAIWVLPSLFGTYGLAKALVQRNYGG